MSRIVVTKVPDIEELLVKDIRDYLENDIRFNVLYPKFGHPNVSQEHPFATMTAMDLGGGNIVQNDIFPAIAVMDMSSGPNPALNTSTEPEDVKCGVPEYNDIANNRNVNIISDVDLDAIWAVVDPLQGNTILWGRGVENMWRSNLAIEIWADNAKVKNVLFHILNGYFVGPRRYEFRTANNAVAFIDSLNAEKTGVYNFDFGMMLYGAMIRISMDYVVGQYIFDTTWGTLNHVDLTEQEVHGHEQGS